MFQKEGFPPGCWLRAQTGRWGWDVTFPVHHLLETNIFQSCISIPPHQHFSNGKALWRRFISSSQLLNSPKFRALNTRSNLWLWLILQQVHPGMLKQSCSSSSCPTAPTMGMQQPHSQLPSHSITPQNTSALLAFAPSEKDPIQP